VHLPHVADCGVSGAGAADGRRERGARRAKDDQPAVQAGLYEIEVFPWI